MIQRNVRWLFSLLTVLAVAATVRGEELSVSLASGRHFTGQLDPRTNQEQLWLRFERGRAAVRRPIDWTSVLEIQQDGEPITREQVERMIADAGSGDPRITGGDPRIRGGGAGSGDPRTTGDPRPTAVRENEKPIATRVRSLSLHAMPANWDADVELDGLAVAVFPLDDNGQTTPISGSLELWLIGEMPPGHRGDRNPRLGHWHLQLQPDDFGWRGGVFRLPFQAAHPEFDTELGAFGAVHARLTIPGQGAFESTVTTRIRPYSGLRDRLQQSAGTRFLPGELHGRFE